MGGNQTTAHSDRSIDSIRFWTTKFWLLKIFGWRHPSYIGQCKTSDPWGGVKFDPRAIIWALLVEAN